MNDRISFPDVVKGIGREFGSFGIVLFIVFVLTIVMGLLFFAMYVARDILVYGGVAFSIGTVFMVVAVGLFLNLYLFKRIPDDNDGFWRLFRSREIPVEEYSKGYRSTYIVQRLSFLIISILLFIFMLFATGIISFVPFLCCILAPITLPMILITVTLPAMAWIVFTYALDPYEPEPRAMIIIGVMWGILSTFPSLFMNTFNGLWMDDAGLSVAVVSAPIFEEFFKSIGFIIIFSQIKDETDGIIYGATFGAGFSLMENLIYGGEAILTGGGLLFIILVGFRSFFNIVGHMIGPSIIGFLIGWNKRVVTPRVGNNGTGSRLLSVFILGTCIIFGYLISVLGHGTWNYLVSFGFSWSFLLALIFGLFQMAFFIVMSLFGYYLATKRYNMKIKTSMRKKKPRVLDVPP